MRQSGAAGHASPALGKIINIASWTVFMGTPLMLHHVASEGAVVAMTRGMARELGEHGMLQRAGAPPHP
jgi:NAD(P)-dependent dehydrogenase (short-subunit alcohol dehydrogenase family)